MIEGKFIPGCGDTGEAMRIRRAVFVAEQGFSAETEEDGTDGVALHLLVRVDGEPAATARLYEAGGCWHIGRVAVLKEHRGNGTGAVVMGMLMQKALQLGAAEVHVGAQKRVEGFYVRLGFAPCGPEYDEEGVPHVPMKAPLGRSCCGCQAGPE